MPAFVGWQCGCGKVCGSPDLTRAGEVSPKDDEDSSGNASNVSLSVRLGKGTRITRGSTSNTNAWEAKDDPPPLWPPRKHS